MFDTEILYSVRAAEIRAEGKRIYAHDPKSKAVAAHRALTQEVIRIENSAKI